MGELALGGKLAQDQESIDLLRKLVEELAAIREKLTRIEGDLKTVQGWIEGKNESLPVLTARVDSLLRHRWSNYIQVQYESNDRFHPIAQGNPDAPSGVAPGRIPYDAFRLRRVRVGFRQRLDPKALLRVSFDLATGVAQTAAQLRDAFVVYEIEPSDVEEGTSVTFGQFILPLGYELDRSSAEREFPERALYNSTLFNGERSRGLLVRTGLGKTFLANVGVVNALTVNDPEQANLAPGVGSRLGLMAGVRHFTDRYDLGLAYYTASRPEYSATSGNATQTSPEVNRRFLYLDGSYIGLFSPNLFVRGEAMLGYDRIPSSSPRPTRVGNDLNGYQLQLGYNLNNRNQLNVRYESFDPNMDIDGDALRGYGLAYVYSLSPGARVTFAHEIFEDPSRAPLADQRFSLTSVRVQFRF